MDNWQIPSDNNIETTAWQYILPNDPNDGNFTISRAAWAYVGDSYIWSGWLEFYLAAPVRCNKVRFWPYTDSGSFGEIEIEVWWNGQWNLIYSGLVQDVWRWWEKTIPGGAKTVQNFRLRVRGNGEPGTTNSIYEFQANQLDKPKQKIFFDRKKRASIF